MKKCNVMARLCGFLISAVLTYVTIVSILNSGLIYAKSILVMNITITIIWMVLLIKARGWSEYKYLELAISIVLLFCVAMFMCQGWNCGYISNRPLSLINAEIEGFPNDTLCHNAIASSIEYYGYPSLLINSADYYNYHFGSHIILGLISKILDIPTIYTYCFIFPVLFYPLYAGLILSVAAEIRRFLNKTDKQSIIDIIVMMLFIMFFIFPKSWETDLGEYKMSWLISESYCVATVLVLLFFKFLLVSVNNEKIGNEVYNNIFYWILIPFFIVIISLSKISVGCIFTCAIVYFIFRKYDFTIKNLIKEIIYLVVFFVVWRIPSKFYSPFRTGVLELPNSISFLSYMTNYVKEPGLWGLHLLVLFCFSLIFIFYRIKDISSIKQLFSRVKNRQFIIEETLVLICIFSSLPGAFFDIYGGSAGYFHTFQKIISMVLIIGFNIPNEVAIRKAVSKNVVFKSFVFIICSCLSFNLLVSSFNNVEFVLKQRKAGIYQGEEDRETGYLATINKINEVTKGHKSDYYIYVCDSASIWTKYVGDTAILFYPAMTGIVCIGELYFENNQLYTNDGKVSNCSYYPNVQDSKMTEDDAYTKAKQDGKEAIIYIFDDTMKIVEIE